METDITSLRDGHMDGLLYVWTQPLIDARDASKNVIFMTMILIIMSVIVAVRNKTRLDRHSGLQRYVDAYKKREKAVISVGIENLS